MPSTTNIPSQPVDIVNNPIGHSKGVTINKNALSHKASISVIYNPLDLELYKENEQLQKELESIEIIVPNIELQRKFAFIKSSCCLGDSMTSSY
jgi:hypothetical protein